MFHVERMTAGGAFHVERPVSVSRGVAAALRFSSRPLHDFLDGKDENACLRDADFSIVRT